MFNALTLEQMDALCELYEAALHADEDITDEQAVEFLTYYLDCEPKEARALRVISKNLPADPTFTEMSDVGLDEFVAGAGDEIAELEAAYGD